MSDFTFPAADAHTPAGSSTGDDDRSLVLPDTELVRSLLSTVTEAESRAVANHSVRSYLFARLLADHLGAAPGRDYDEQLLFAACVLHDIGLSPAADGPQRFEVDGADFAARLLTDHGVPAAGVDAVWEAIALHTSGGIAERRGLLCRLTRDGVGMDFGRDTDFVTDAQAQAIHAAYPRLGMERELVETIVEQARRTPSKAPRYSFADVLLLERGAAAHTTRIEQGAAHSRWSA
ncbi:HD domain-containing protein [Streptomyces sp. KR55]|uniref:HD domain-containing protein n=1 Tax=Streptomyces sp. KR55 TaxID=3457425 RepID=UPI003FD5227E